MSSSIIEISFVRFNELWIHIYTKSYQKAKVDFNIRYVDDSFLKAKMDNNNNNNNNNNNSNKNNNSNNDKDDNNNNYSNNYSYNNV